MTGVRSPLGGRSVWPVFVALLLAVAAEAAFTRYQQALRALSSAIDERNRERVQPFQTFNPALLQSS